MRNRKATDADGSTQPLVSVIMNCYNGEKYLKEAIDSVFAQEYQNWEIVFWDNASSDKSADIAQSYRDKRFRYFRGEVNVPLGRARNLAIGRCRGEFIAFLDSDDLWLPGKLARQVPILLGDESIGLIYSDVNYFNDRQEVSRLYSLRKPYRGHCFQNLLTDYCLCLSTCVVRKSTLDSLEYWFDEKLNMCEESDLFLRISLKSKIDFVPDILAMYRVHNESWTSRDPESFISESEHILEKLKAIPGVCENFVKPMGVARRNLATQEAKLAWRRGKATRARHIIRDKLPLNFSSIALFAATIFPFEMLDYAYKRVMGVVRPAK